MTCHFSTYAPTGKLCYPMTTLVMFYIIAGRGVVAKREILQGTCVLHYVGTKQEKEPPPDMDDTFIYEMRLGRKTIW